MSDAPYVEDEIYDDEYDAHGAEDEVVPDYSRVGFKALRVLCKDRGIPGDGNSIALIERLKAWDAQHGKSVDLSAVENLDPDESDDDPLGLDDPDDSPNNLDPILPAPVMTEPGCTHPKCILDHPHVGPAILAPAPESPAGGGEAASAPPPTGAPAREYRHEITIGPRDVSDADHFAYIAEAHAAAHAAGYETLGGATVGHRVGYGVDSDGHRTVIYQVSLRRRR